MGVLEVNTDLKRGYKEDARGVKAGVAFEISGVCRVAFERGGEERPKVSKKQKVALSTLTSRYKDSRVGGLSEILSR
jgi:hypothetical protein